MSASSLPSFIKIYRAVLEKMLKMVKFTDKRNTMTIDNWSIHLRWAKTRLVRDHKYIIISDPIKLLQNSSSVSGEVENENCNKTDDGSIDDAFTIVYWSFWLLRCIENGSLTSGPVNLSQRCRDKNCFFYLFIFMPSDWMIGHIVFVLSVCLFVCLFVCLSVVNLNIRYNFWIVRDRDFFFGMHTYSTNDTLSKDTKVNNLVTLTLTLKLLIAFWTLLPLGA